MSHVNPRIGIVTVTYNSAEVLPGFMKCLLSQTFENWELFCIDNASTDGTLAQLLTYEDLRVKVTANNVNVGIAAGNNQGIKKSLEQNFDYILLINNDVEFEKNMIHDLLGGIELTKADIVAPKIYYFDSPNLIWYAGGGFEVYRFWANKHYGMNKFDNNDFKLMKRVDYAPTCCVLIKKEVFIRIGLMDEKYFVYFDDVDFFYRARKSKIVTFFLPSVILLHKVSSLTGGAFSDFGVRITARNAVYFARKHASGLRYVIALILQKLAIYLGLLTRKYGMNLFRSKLKGFSDGMAMITTKKKA